ncbi:hypothetical protein P4S63_08145 [Pseudoalteromonas sp. B193]
MKLIAGVDYEYETRGDSPVKGAQVVNKNTARSGKRIIFATLSQVTCYFLNRYYR